MFNYQIIDHFKNRSTPFYYYDLDLLRETMNELSELQSELNIRVHYAIKANPNIRILKMARENDLGADCVSGNEISRAIEAGMDPGDVVLAGVGKTDEEIRHALKNKIAYFNVESLHELSIIDAIAGKMGVDAPVAFRINPDVNGETHRNITTGTKYDKFGIPSFEIPHMIKALESKQHIDFKGLHFHIGSQIRNFNIFQNLAHKVNSIQDEFINAGHPPSILNLGGGLGIDYQNPDGESIPDFRRYFRAYLSKLNRLPGQKLHFELGRSVVGNCGSLITQLLYIKKSRDLTFAIVDAGMNDLMRPALYQASHKIQCITRLGKEQAYEVVGPVCESSDVFGHQVQLPELHRGDLLAIRSAGAYGQSMGSGYNLRNPTGTIYSDEMINMHPGIKRVSEI